MPASGVISVDCRIIPSTENSASRGASRWFCSQKATLGKEVEWIVVSNLIRLMLQSPKIGGLLLALWCLSVTTCSAAPAMQSQVDAIKRQIEDNQLIEAEKAAKKLVQKNPKSAPAHSTLGRVLFAKQDYKACEQELRKAIKLDPKLAEAHWHLGMALQELNQHYPAMKELEIAVRLKPKILKDKNCSDCSWIKKLLH